MFAGDLLQSTTIRDTAANAATVSSLFTMVRIVAYTLKNANDSWFNLFSKIVLPQRGAEIIESLSCLTSARARAFVIVVFFIEMEG